jgi:hypothetical protein
LDAQHDKFDADLRTSALLGMASVQSIHDYYPFALEDGGRLAPMAVELVDRLAILVAVRRVLCVLALTSVCNNSFVELLVFLLGVFRGTCRENSCNVFMLLFILLCVAGGVACLPVPRAWVFFSFLLFAC